MYSYSRSLSEVFRTPAEWWEFYLPLLEEQEQGLIAQNCGWLYNKAEQLKYEPSQYPALAYIDLHGDRVGIKYLYQSQIMELLGLDSLVFKPDAIKYGCVYVSPGPGIPKDIPICSQRLVEPKPDIIIKGSPLVKESPSIGESLDREI